MTSPTPFRYPPRTKIVAVAVLALAAVGFTLAVLTADTDGEEGGAEVSGTDQATSGSNNPVLDVLPPRDAPVVLAQETIVLRLEPGWLAELVLEPRGADPIPLPASEVDQTELNQFVYVPGDDRAVERLPSGRNCVHYTIWDQVRGREASETTGSWCFSVT